VQVPWSLPLANSISGEAYSLFMPAFVKSIKDCSKYGKFVQGPALPVQKVQQFNFYKIEAVPKLQFLKQLLTPGENCMRHKCLASKELAIFSKSLFQN
jgi:hypothetical protein